MPYRNPDDKRRNAQRDRRENPEKYRTWNRNWRANNPEKDRILRQRERTNLLNDPERFERRRLAGIESRRAFRQKVLDKYGGSCVCCGESIYEFLSFDHVNGLGTSTRMAQSKMLIWLLESHQANIQILCHNCNLAKGFYGRCPHNDRS